MHRDSLHLLNALDGYLHCDQRIADAGIYDPVWFESDKRDRVAAYLNSEAKLYGPALAATTELIEGLLFDDRLIQLALDRLPLAGQERKTYARCEACAPTETLRPNLL